MRHHPKSNNGHFSKKQKKASRTLMANRGYFQARSAVTNQMQGQNPGLLQALAQLMRMKLPRKTA